MMFGRLLGPPHGTTPAAVIWAATVIFIPQGKTCVNIVQYNCSQVHVCASYILKAIKIRYFSVAANQINCWIFQELLEMLPELLDALRKHAHSIYRTIFQLKMKILSRIFSIFFLVLLKT